MRKSGVGEKYVRVVHVMCESCTTMVIEICNVVVTESLKVEVVLHQDWLSEPHS